MGGNPRLGAAPASRLGAAPLRRPGVPPPRPALAGALPNRYRIRRTASRRLLVCTEAPTLAVRIERGFTVTAAAARTHPPGSIFLDGAAQGAPFLDPGRGVFNLDHHEGCVRAFTLATCEQAMVLLRRGLDLRRRDWTLYANDADLDTVLAIWVLLNHLRLRGESSPVRDAIMPLVRLQGAIDAHGLELQDVCALPPELLAATRARMARLREPELALKAQGRWNQVDLLAYTADRLRALDALVYAPGHFERVPEIEELARAEVAEGSLAVACRSEAGIYEVERELRKLHGDRLAVIVLQKDPRTYSLRQVDPGLPATLEKVYARLNLLDPSGGGNRSANRWGGSAEIGGSPRHTGTRATPELILAACRHAYRRPTSLERAARLVEALLGSAAVGCIALTPTPALPLLVGLLGGLAYQRAPGLYGLRRPSGLDWLWLVPVALAGALLGGVWLPESGAGGALAPPGPAAWLPLLTLPLAAEVWFRGLGHGHLASSFPIQHAGGPWFVSVPVVASAVLYAGVVGVLAILAPPVAPAPPLDQAALGSMGALLFGLASGLARERSESLLPPLLLLGLGLAAVGLVATHGG